MRYKDINKISELLREKRVTHLLLARTDDGISLSCIATGDDIFEFLQTLIDTNEDLLDIIRAVVRSRMNRPKPELLN